MSDPLERLRDLANQLPCDLVADWQWTNHYELTSAQHADYFWLDLTDFEDDKTESGKRAGLLLDIAAEVSRLKREGVLSERKPTVAERIVSGLEEYVGDLKKGGE